MKRLFISLCALSMVLSANAIKVYVNPGHGSWGSNCRPMATINYAAGDTLGFFESNTNLWKAFMLETKLKAAGFDVKMSRRASGGSGTNEYNKALSTICSEAENYGADYFISIHSNAGPDGSNGSFANYPVILYRGYTGQPKVAKSDVMAKKCVARLYDIFYATPKNKNGGGGPEFTTYYSPSNPDILGDLSFYETSSTYGYLGALKHEIPGFLSEGYFHTYSPARHRALNPDWCREEGIRYYRGIMDYYGKAKENVGYILGYVRSKTEKFSHTHYIPHSSSNDVYKPINGAKVVLRNAQGELIKCNCYPYVKRMLKNQDYYTTDHNYNGIFMFENLAPGKYTVSVHASGYKDYTGTITVTADKTTYPEIFLEKGQGTAPDINPDIKWVLNGGIIPGGDVPSNADLWETFKPDFNSYYGINRSDQAITNVAVFWPSGIDSDNDNILTNANSTYKWLGAYIQSVAGVPNGELWWRANLHAFFNCAADYKLGSVAAADFSQAGKPAAWGEAYLIATGTSATLPSSVKETYVIPTPKKEGDIFIGWYNNPRGDGTSISSIPAGYKGTIYAIWQYQNPDSDREIYTVTWVLNGGIIPGGEVPTNNELWTSFMDGFNAYYTGYSNETGTFKTRTARSITEVLEFTWTNIGALGLAFMTDANSPWKWLGDYILSIANAQGIAITTDSEWRQQFYAFFNCTNVSKKADGSVVGPTVDFTQAGQPAAWGDAYRIAMGMSSELPSVIEAPYTIPTPIRIGYIFRGWYDNPEGTGTALTVLPTGYYGTVYALWKSGTNTAVENINLPLDIHAPMYDILGRPVNHTYHGIVIQNGNIYFVK